ncbi:MAG: NADH-quinone oxidoreductase subunit J [Gemmatimonadaceae bacterium]|nr:NADH-quinone oxidoreductase subunit J [Gemmatimonadaceae bacterium]
MSGFYAFQFYLFALLAIGSALLFVTRRKPVPAALWLMNVMFALSGLYVMLDAPFVGVIQVLVYAGAIMVVFVFVVMLLNLSESPVTDVRRLGVRSGAGVVALALLANLLVVLRAPIARVALAPETTNAVMPVAVSLFTDYLVAFELTSVVLLVAVIGAVLLAKKRVRA